MAEALRTLLVLDTQGKATRVLRELTTAGYEPLQVWVKSSRPLGNALRHRSWDLLIADSRLWKELNHRDPKLRQMQPGLPALLIAEGAEPEPADPQPGQPLETVAWGALEALAPAVRRLLAGPAGQAESAEAVPAAGSESLLSRTRNVLRRYYALILSILVGVAATVAIFLYYQKAEQVRLASDFETMARDRAQSLRVELAKHETVLRLLGGFFEASGETIPGDYAGFAVEFREFSHGVLSREPHLQAVAIIPRLPDAERPRFEQAAGALSGFRLTEVSESGEIRPAGRRSQYYPVLVAEPHSLNAAILGLDLATAPGLWEAMRHAMETGKLTASGKNRLPDPQAELQTVWQFLPVYQDEGQGELKGFAALVFRVDWLMERSLAEAPTFDIELELADSSGPEGFVYYHRSPSRKQAARYQNRTQTTWSDTLQAGERTWTLSAYATYGFVARHRTWQSWFLLVAGLAFSASTGVYFARRIREAGHTERLVQERTLALSRQIEKQRRLQRELESSRLTLTSRVEELDQHNREIRLLNELGDVLQACLSTEEAYPVVAQYVPKLLPGSSGALYVYEPARDLLAIAAEWGPSPPEAAAFKSEDCWALRLGKVHAVTTESGLPPCRHAPSDPEAGLLCVPLSAMGESLGLFHASGCPDSGQAFAISVAEHIGLALSNLKLRSTLKELSIHDPLTNLHNRRYMEEALELELRRAERKKLTVGLIMLDIDHFKAFNDGFGHGAGDELLRSLGAAMRGELRAGDVACRYGGEEFLLILPEATLEVTTRRAEQLRLHVKQMKVSYLDKPLGQVTISLGVAVYPRHGRQPGELIKSADAALYRAKAEGRDRVASAVPPQADPGDSAAPAASAPTTNR
jgi:diguanylate cyclase (GGDEF)-like protein